MKKTKCKVCGKEVEGYSKNHAAFLLEQHMYVHRREDRTKKKEDEKDGNN